MNIQNKITATVALALALFCSSNTLAEERIFKAPNYKIAEAGALTSLQLISADCAAVFFLQSQNKPFSDDKATKEKFEFLAKKANHVTNSIGAFLEDIKQPGRLLVAYISLNKEMKYEAMLDKTEFCLEDFQNDVQTAWSKRITEIVNRALKRDGREVIISPPPSNK